MSDTAVSPFLRRPTELQVFVDPTGRRARRLHRGVLVVGLACAVWLAGLAAGVVGFAHLPGLPTLAAGRAPVAHPVRGLAVSAHVTPAVPARS